MKNLFISKIFVFVVFITVISGFLANYGCTTKVTINKDIETLYYDETFYPGWEEYGSYHDIDGFIGFDNGYEDVDSYDSHTIVNLVTTGVGGFGGNQFCWHNMTWDCPFDAYYKFTFDYDYSGSGQFIGWTFWGDFECLFLDLYFNVCENTDLDEKAFHYERRVFHDQQIGIPFPIPIPITKDFDIGNKNEYITSGPIFCEEGEHLINCANRVNSNSIAAMGGSGVNANVYGELKSIRIQLDTSSSPALRVSPDPPNYNFGEVTVGETLKFNFSVWNGGVDTLSWTVSDNKNWMEISPTEGTSTQNAVNHEVAVDTSELNIGIYTGDIYIDSNVGTRTGLIEFEIINSPPFSPAKPDGPMSGLTGEELTFSTYVYDIDNDDIYYLFDWGDGTDSGWLGPVPSDSNVEASKFWINEDTYDIRAKAKDSQEEESEWSEEFAIEITPRENTPPYAVDFELIDDPPIYKWDNPEFSATLYDDENDMIQYRLQWKHEDDEWKERSPDIVESGESIISRFMVETYGIYHVRYKMVDDPTGDNDFSDGLIGYSNILTLTIPDNTPPHRPEPPYGSNKKTLYHRYSQFVDLDHIYWTDWDPDRDKVRFLFDWGDGSDPTWTDYVDSNEKKVFTAHTWNKTGTFYLYVTTEDEHGLSNKGPAQEIVVSNPCCFPEGTKITMADGTYKNIEEIRIGEKVLSYDVEKDEFANWRVKMLGYPVHPVVTINDGLIQATVDHPFYVKKSDGTKSWAAYDPNIAETAITYDGAVLDLEVGDQLYSSDLKWIKVENIEYNSELIQTYNIISFSGSKTYFANDVLVYEEHPPQIMTNYFLRLLGKKFPQLEESIRNSFWFERIYQYLP